MLCLDYAGIGRRIREKRKEKFLTQAELADRADTTSSHMSHIENNTTKLSLTLIVAIANHLDVSVDYLLGPISSTIPLPWARRSPACSRIARRKSSIKC